MGFHVILQLPERSTKYTVVYENEEFIIDIKKKHGLPEHIGHKDIYLGMFNWSIDFTAINPDLLYSAEFYINNAQVDRTSFTAKEKDTLKVKVDVWHRITASIVSCV